MAVWFLGGAAVLFMVVLCVRALLFRPHTPDYGAAVPVTVDAARAVDHLAQMVRVPTVSNSDAAQMIEADFARFRTLLQTLYPQVHNACAPMRIGPTGLLFHWRGKSASAPTVLMAHYDVVPADETGWQHAPFGGETVAGELWGRGTLDTKITLMGILEAAEQQLTRGFVPENDVYFSFSGDEEINGPSTPAIVDWFVQNGVKPALVLDEGGAVVQGGFPGVKKPIAVVGIGEKGLMNVELTAHSAGGHASTPMIPSTLGILCKAVTNCERRPFAAHLTKPVRALIAQVGPHAPFALRLVFANLWCFGGLLAALAGKLGGELNAMMRTTMAFTMAKGAPQINVLPTQAVAGVNLRLVNTDTPERVEEHLKKCIHSEKVTVKTLYAQNASPYAATQGRQWDIVAAAVAHTWPDAIVSPYLMMACSDSRHYSRICTDVYKFSAMALSAQQRGLIHNHDERIPVADIPKTVEFFLRLTETL